MSESPTGVEFVEPIVGAVKSASYPDGDIAAAELSSAVYADLHHALQQAKHEVVVQVSSLSDQVAPDVDGWIARATKVQHDIEQSKATARSIVEAAEAHNTLEQSTKDAAQNVNLLEKELAFSSSLEEALVYIQSVSQRLAVAKEKVVGRQILKAFSLLSETQSDLDNLQISYSTNASRALSSRASGIREAIIQASREHVGTCIRIIPGESVLDVSAKRSRYGDAGLDSCADILRQTESVEVVVQALRRDLGRTFFDIWSEPTSPNGTARLQTTTEKAWLDHESRSADVKDIIADAGKFVGFLQSNLPTHLLQPIAETVLPRFWEALECNRLNDSVPVDVEHLGSFDEVLAAVSRFSHTLATAGWSGHDKVQEWIVGAPRVWLSRQREHTLQQVRASLLGNLRQTRQVEKVETQIVEPEEDDPAACWDTEWKEQDESAQANRVEKSSIGPEDDDDASAWDMDAPSSPPNANGHGGNKAGDNEVDDDGAAWGWDEGSSQKTKSQPATSTLAGSSNKGREVTLREPYMVTAVPDALFAECTKVFVKAKQLSGEQFATSAIAPGINGLSNIPTLATALYRAMAITAYDKIDNGKMLLYNDSMRLADLLKTLTDGTADMINQIDINASLHRKLVQDTTAFERFAKVSYAAEMESQKTIIRDMMDGAQGFSNCTSNPYMSECDDAVSMTVDRLRAVHDQWTGILSKSALLQSVGSLLAATASKFMVDVQELSDIGEEESKKLLSYLKRLSGLSDLFVEQHVQTNESRDMTPLYVSNWLKFQYFGELLDGNLADIKYLWAEGELSLEFQTGEVVDLIEALFADSEHRRKAIAEIRNRRG